MVSSHLLDHFGSHQVGQLTGPWITLKGRSEMISVLRTPWRQIEPVVSMAPPEAIPIRDAAPNRLDPGIPPVVSLLSNAQRPHLYVS